MNNMTMIHRVVATFLLIATIVSARGAETLYQNDFEQTDAGQVPDDFLVIDGQFAVRELEGNKHFELPGAPLESFGFLMGPAQKEGLAVSGRVRGTRRGRKYPTFAVSLGGVSGYRLRVAPAKRAVEIVKNDVPLVSEPFAWESGSWTLLRLQVRKVEAGLWKVEGKVWLEGQPEPEDWTITMDEKQEPVPGRPGAWGSPFSGTPIWFDDLVVKAAEEKR